MNAEVLGWSRVTGAALCGDQVFFFFDLFFLAKLVNFSVWAWGCGVRNGCGRDMNGSLGSSRRSERSTSARYALDNTCVIIHVTENPHGCQLHPKHIADSQNGRTGLHFPAATSVTSVLLIMDACFQFHLVEVVLFKCFIAKLLVLVLFPGASVLFLVVILSGRKNFLLSLRF